MHRWAAQCCQCVTITARRFVAETAAGWLDQDRRNASFGGEVFEDAFVNPLDAVLNLLEAGVQPRAPNPPSTANTFEGSSLGQ